MTPSEYFATHFSSDFAKKTFAVDWTDDAITFPIYDIDGKLLFCRYRHLTGENKFSTDKGAHPALFAIHKARTEPWVVLTEGEPDCIRLWQEGIPSVTGTSGVKTFNAKVALPLKDKIVNICLDTDLAGQESIEKYAQILKEIGAIPVVIDLPKEFKDVCEFFTAGKTAADFHKLIQTSTPIDDWLIAHEPETFKTMTVTELYAEQYPEEAWIIDKVLPQTGITMFSGDSGVGKSWLSLEVVRALVNNDIFLDHFEIKTQNVPILIIDKENGLRRIQKRMLGLGVKSTNNVHLLKYSEKFVLTDEAFIMSVKRFIERKQIGIIIVDSFIDILVGNENDSADTADIFNALRNISNTVCWVLLHHETKPVARFTPTAGNRARGSTNIKAQLDYLFSVQATPIPKVINIEQGKARDYEILPKFAIEYITIPETGEMGGFKYLGDVVGEVNKVEEACSFIEGYLTLNSNKSVQEINDAGEGEGIASAQIGRALKLLKEKKVVDSNKGRNGIDKRKTFYFITGNDEQTDLLDEVDDIVND